MSVQKEPPLEHYCQSLMRSVNETTANEHILLSDTLRSIFESYSRLLNRVFMSEFIKIIFQRCPLVTFNVEIYSIFEMLTRIIL